MLKHYTAYRSWAVPIMLISLLISSNASAQVSTQQLSLQELAERLRTPEEIAHYMWRHFSFETDHSIFGRNEYWQSPAELLSQGKGDCEDFAIFAREMLKRNGVNAFLVNIYGDRSAHTVVVFKEGGRYNAIDGTSVIRSRADSLKELITEISPFWKEGAIVISSPTHKYGKTLKQFQKKIRAKFLIDRSV